MKTKLQNHRLWALAIGCLLFIGLSQWSRTVSPLFGLATSLGIILPLGWGWFTKEWRLMGFTRKKLMNAILWSLAAGTLGSVLGLLVMQKFSITADLWQQLLIGVPMWLLLISPFQEFFFRGWMQSGLSERFGDWSGLLLANIAFTLWHYLSPLVDMAEFPLISILGVASTFLAGLGYGFAFMQCKNIIAPWLAHAFTGTVFIIVGAMDFISIVG